MSEPNRIYCNVTETVIDLIRELTVSFHDSDEKCYTHIPKVTNINYLVEEIEIAMTFNAIGTSKNHNWQSLSFNEVIFGKGYLTISFKVNYNSEIEPNICGTFESDGIFIHTSAHSVKNLIEKFLECVDEFNNFNEKINNYINQIPTNNIVIGIPKEDK